MKNEKIIIVLIIIGLTIIGTGIYLFSYFLGSSSQIRGKGTARLDNPGEVVIIIEKNKKCTPVNLSLYADGTYELFTDYESCRPFQKCTLKLHYTKSIKGKYDYDITKILDNSINENDSTLNDNQIDYKIYTRASGSDFVLGEKYNHDYIIQKGENNEYLEQLLNTIDIDLDIYALPDYR